MHCTNCGAPCYGTTPGASLCPRCQNLLNYGDHKGLAHFAMTKANHQQQHQPSNVQQGQQRQPHEASTGQAKKLADFPRYRAIVQIIARLKTASDNAEYQGVLSDLHGRIDLLCREGLGIYDPTEGVQPVMSPPTSPEAPPQGLAPAPGVLAQAQAGVTADEHSTPNSIPVT